MSKRLKDILFGVDIMAVVGSIDQTISAITFDSRKCIEGSLYIAQKGTQVDGHDFIEAAIKNGAKTVVCEEMPQHTADGICCIQVKASPAALGFMAANFYDQPSKKLQLVGVTGTNGKTTTVTLLHDLFTQLGIKVGLISTVVNRIGEEEVASTHTTPDAVQLNELLVKMHQSACTHVFMEVSSHAVVQHRVTGLNFKGGVFTNISHDHLDFHKTFKAYIHAKQGFFNLLPTEAFALSNKDDKNGAIMLQNSEAKKYFYGIKTLADFKTKVIESDFEGLNLQIDGVDFWTPLIGRFNAYNITAVYATATLLGQNKLAVLTALSSIKGVSGRFQHIKLNGISGIVDYAHTPDALENVLKTIKNIRTGNEQVITVIGCGGDRDRSKRPLMAAIACKLSDRILLTSDNPRTESPETIIEEMKVGVEVNDRKKVLSIVDRREAIRTAAGLAQIKDILLVAGKGHETYQEINGERSHFDDMEELTKALNEN